MKFIKLLLIPLLFSSQALSYSNLADTFVHLFEWKWSDIAKECKNYLGPMGYKAVQVSPPNEHVLLKGYPWYQRYQPVSYKIYSRSGTRREFKHMVEECAKAGVDIYVDAVINHMSWAPKKGEWYKGIAGTNWGHYIYDGTYQWQDFHHCGKNGNDDIKDYNNRWEVQNCELVNLSDLKTESEYVQNRIATYLNDLISMGVKGFRIDAAKHIPANQLRSITDRLNGNPYIFQEVIDVGGSVIKSKEYFQSGDVTEFNYSLDLSRVFKHGKLAWLNGNHQFGEGWGYIPKNRSVVFVDNHDNQRGHGSGGDILNFKDKQRYILANILMLAWPYGYPKVMSSYNFLHPSQGPPSYPGGRTAPIYGKNGVGCLPPTKSPGTTTSWICEHRWPQIANMIKFRKATASTPFITDWWTNGHHQIAFGRGDKGFVVINGEGSHLKRQFKTSLSHGKYCESSIGFYELGDCKSNRYLFIDKNGITSTNLKPYSFIILSQIQY